MYLTLGKSVDVRMVPIEARRLVFGNDDAVVEGLASLDHGVKHLVLMTDGCNIQSMEVQIGRVRAHSRIGTVLLDARWGHALTRVFLVRRCFSKLVLEMYNKAVAGPDAQGGRLKARIGHVTVADR